MSKKSTYNKKNFIFDNQELIQMLRQSRTNYDYPVAKISDFLGDWVVLETFVPEVITKHARKDKPSYLLIISTLKDPKDPESERTWCRFKVFCGSLRINNFLIGLRESDRELSCFPLVLRFISVSFFDKKSGTLKRRYEIDCGLDDNNKFPVPPTLGPQF